MQGLRLHPPSHPAFTCNFFLRYVIQVSDLGLIKESGFGVKGNGLVETLDVLGVKAHGGSTAPELCHHRLISVIAKDKVLCSPNPNPNPNPNTNPNPLISNLHTTSTTSH